MQIALQVTYEGRTTSMPFIFEVLRSTQSLFQAFKDKIGRNFNIKEIFHLVAFKDDGSGEFDIENNDDVHILFENPNHSIKAYIGGPWNIWLGKEQHWLTHLPKSTMCLIRLAKVDILPDFNKIEFIRSQHQLLRSIKLANAHLILSERSRTLSNDLNVIGHNNISRVIGACSETLNAIAVNTKKILDRMITMFAHMRDRRVTNAGVHLEDLIEVTKDMANESAERIKDLDQADHALTTLLQKVEHTITHTSSTRDFFARESKKVIEHLEDAIKKLRKVRSVMAGLNKFWNTIKTGLGNLTDNPMVIDAKQTLTVPAEGVEEHRRNALDVWRSREFKINAVIFIARHSAIRDICMECQGPTKELEDKMRTFLEEYWHKPQAQLVCDELSNDPEHPQDIQATAEYHDDEDTEWAVREALGLPYERVVRVFFREPTQESGYADIALPSENGVGEVCEGTASLAIGSEQNAADDDFHLVPFN